VDIDIDRKTEQSEVKNYKEVDTVSKDRSFQKEKEINEVCNKRQAQYPGGEEKVQGFRRGYALKNKEELTRKEKEKENQHTYLKGGKTERNRSALIAPKGVLVVSTNNSALGKGLASHSTDWNRGQNHKK
ncbi:9976_t:CDS:2, partial [Gigaspora margarita]